MKTIQFLVVLSVAVALSSAAPAKDDIDWSSVLPIEETPEFLERYPIYKTLFPESLSSESRIVGGNEVSRNSLPYQVAMLLTVSGGQALCGGSIVSNNYVLTAAHCTDAVSQALVIMGAHDRTIVEATQIRQTISSTNFRPHPQYAAATLSNDISLIRLNAAVTFTTAINRISLPTRTEASNQFVGVTATVSGWGRTSDGSAALPNILRYVTIPVIANTDCAAVFGSNIIQSFVLCASASGGRGSCSGDSGGPLTYNSKLIGVVSFGAADGCQLGYPVAFARVTSFLDWIGTNSDVTILN